ncbi:MAG TPA: LytTR family DNA-binding domain-containing protein [Acidobacteriota bacterium]|nr:LytTR family DNA-binding domain-containing protein [Acidobacteriota bacterium]HNB72367.1 LytTR family DNA-binding domain-containing protein [Acidobacteriota bacterium]HNC45785.1 LytTR family DNA-binding domain-containing protein [Acidobacteriota bacterium]HNG93493.1 LytTR family DNA-binding domain-containing protein [Acidobacteriota bacterium]HNH81251.1 LytTR family DNA-binding domain-containing protein [Acidobacteriota bacterium]
MTVSLDSHITSATEQLAPEAVFEPSASTSLFTSTTIRTMIVSTDTLIRNQLRNWLEDRPEFECVGECATGYGTLKALEEGDVELLFLDHELPWMDGFQVAETIRRSPLPGIVLLSSSELFAFRAFEIQAVDFLLKHGDRSRFDRALRRAKELIQTIRERDVNQQLFSLLEKLKTPEPKYLEQVVVKTTRNSFLLKLNDVNWIEAEGNYVRLHLGRESHLIRESISHFESKIDPKIFTRIHRSVIVNFERVAKWYPLFHGDYKLILQDGTELTLSRRYRKNMKTI